MALTSLALITIAALQPYDDFHYPSEEPAELAGADVPECVHIGASTTALRDPATGQTVTALSEGGVAFGRWHVLSEPQPVRALRWLREGEKKGERENREGRQ